MGGPGVAEVLPILAPYKVASRETKSEPTVVKAGSLTIGGNDRRDRRALFRRKPGADPGIGRRGQGSRGDGAARRSVQAAHQSLQLSRATG